MPTQTVTDARFARVVDILLTERATPVRGMTAKELADKSGIHYRTLMRQLPSWTPNGIVVCNNRRWPNEYYYDAELGTAHLNRDRLIQLPDSLTREQVLYVKDRVSEILAVAQSTSQGTISRLTDEVWRGQMLSTATIPELTEIIKDDSKLWQSRANNALTIISLLLREEERKQESA